MPFHSHELNNTTSTFHPPSIHSRHALLISIALTSFLLLSFKLLLNDGADRMNRCSADPAGPFGTGIGDSEDLRRLLVEQQLMIAKKMSGDVPVEVLSSPKA